MENFSGKASAKTYLERYLPERISTIVISSFYVIIGMTAIALHARFRSPLHMPGHHGIEFMALLLLTVLSSKNKMSGMFFSAGVLGMLFVPWLNFKDPFMELVMLLPGFFVTFSNIVLPDKSISKFFPMLLISGIAYALIPLSRLAIHEVSGFPYISLMAAPVVVIATHFFFGMAGGLLGYSIQKATKKLF